MSRNNNVRGPTSALTEFLKASGITPTVTAQARRQRQQQEAAAGPSGTSSAGAGVSAGGDGDVEMANGESNEADRSEETPSSGRVTRSGRKAPAALNYNSDDLDDDTSDKPTPAKKRKMSKAAEAKLKAKAKAKANKNKKLSDDEYEDDSYTALPRMFNSASTKPAVGSFHECSNCQKEFTVTKYTLAAASGHGYLCHPCGKESGVDPFKKASPVKRRKVQVDKRSIVNFEEKRFPTLASMCIQLITKHIDDVEALGDIGAINMEAISKALAKNRGLTPENAQLFYNVTNTTLTLHDATNLPSTALETLIHLNPNLTYLRLDFCGHLDNTAMHTLSTSLPALTHLELLGPFLVRSPAWQEFFASHPNLQAFKITQSPRFDLDCMAALKTHSSTTLKSLRLHEVEKVSDEFLGVIQECEALEDLDLGNSATASDPCSEDALTEMLKAISGKLCKLDLSRHARLADDVLIQGLKDAKNMTDLVLMNAPQLSDEGIALFFEEWENPPLRVINLSRNYELGSKALVALLKHSGERLEELGVNGWGDVELEALKMVGRLAGELRSLDVGWVREVDDFIVKAWMDGEDVEEPVVASALKDTTAPPPPEEWEKEELKDPEASSEDSKGKGKVDARINGCRRLNEVKVWGCSKLTTLCPKRKGISIYGVVDSHTAI